MKKRLFVITILMSIGCFLSAESFGSSGALNEKDLDLKEMLQYALEDEHTALAEYETLMEKYGFTRPYTNIAESEKTHIAYLEELYRKHDLEVPAVNAEDHLVVASSITEAAEIGVQAEINNIAMYELFLDENLPEDVREVFLLLQRASENHLEAFKRQLDIPPGRGRNRA